VRLRWSRAVGGLTLVGLITLAGAPVRAQSQSDRQPRPARGSAPAMHTEPAGEVRQSIPLAEQNFALVAASTDQIRQVLLQEPALMVELKRLLASRATEVGQLLSEEDLTDQAVYERLDADTRFRAEATRLLQRYGYLLPNLNPKSDLAQERDVLLKERALQLARIEEQQRTAAPATRPAETPAAPACPPGASCAAPAAPGITPVAPSGPMPIEPTIPRRPPQQVMTAEMQTELTSALPPTGSATRSLAGTGAAPLAQMQAQQLAPQPSARPGWVGPGVPQPEQVNPAPALLPAEAPMEEVEGGAQPAVYGPRPRLPVTAMMRPSREQPGHLAERPNPFADIPALYDMYRQAAPPGRLERFGADVFQDSSAIGQQLIPMDLPVGPDYVVGPGDGLTIDLWGSVSQRLVRVVDRTGRISLPEVGPVLVSGKTLGQVQRTVQQLLRTQFRDVSADVSLTRLRTVRIYVVGDVEHPGAYDVSSLSTPLNAVFAAGGPTAIGSLRVVEHWRGKQLVQTVDLYDLLLHGVRDNLQPLSNGDTVRVPTLGPQVTVQGMVRRPAIYELHGEQSLAQVLELAGGVLPTATLRHIQVERLVAHQKKTMLSLDVNPGTDAQAAAKLTSFRVQDGDVITVFPVAPYNQDAVYLDGHVLRPGKYAYRAGMRLTDLVGSYKDLLPEPADYAEIIRLEPPDFHPVVRSFSLAQALAHPAQAPLLRPLDTVRVYSRYAFEDLPTVYVGGEVRHPGLYRTAGQIHLRDAIGLAGGLTRDADLTMAQVFHYLPNSRLRVSSVNLERALAGDPTENILLGPRDFVLVQRNPARVDPPAVYIKGEVAHPGRYPLTVNMHISDLVRVSGGLLRSADRSVANLTRYTIQANSRLTGQEFTVDLGRALAGDPDQNLALRDGDTLTIRQLPNWQDIGAAVTIRGEVVHPGVYGIRPGERLSSLLERAGGFTPTAYPEGIVFEREEVRQLQQQSRQQLIAQIRQQAATFRTTLQTTAAEQAQLQQAAFQQAERAITALEQAPVTGRMVIRLTRDLRRFRNSPDDIMLRAGDRIYIPKRPDFVLVTGQVYNPNAITFRPHRNVGWYLRQAGGPTPNANRHGIFVVRANGEVVSGHQGGWWLGGIQSVEIQPGDAIIVPEKPVGENPIWRNLVAVAQIASSAAVTAAVATNY
jgi:polysaccharide export outer membrane protein